MSVSAKLLGMPVDLWVQMQQYTDALVREYRLLNREGGPGVDRRLLDLFDEVIRNFDRSTVPKVRAMLRSAIESGGEAADLDLEISADEVAATAAVHDALCQIDDYCRRGVLLTLPLAPEVAHVRSWAVAQLQRQLAGQPPARYERQYAR